jgi:Flp pilus assembly protein TadG
MKTQAAAHRSEKGQSLVELAMSFTFLLLIVTGVLDLGGMFYTYTALQDTTLEGAIYGSSHPTDTTGIADYIRKSAKAPLDAATIGITDITVTCNGLACVTTDINSCQGQIISVEVLYNYKLTMPIIPVLLRRQNIVLKSTVTGTILQSTETIAGLKALPTPLTCN